MKKIKSLPKKFEMQSVQGVPYYYDDTWLTNGHFMIKKEQVKDYFQYCAPNPRASEVDLKRVVPCNPDKIWQVTDTIYDMSTTNGKNTLYRRVFECKETGETVCFSEEYIRYFGIHALKSERDNGKGAFMCLSENVVIMPCRHHKTTFNNQ